jgi:chromosome segregation protein
VGGSISGGAFKNNSNLLGRRREIEEIEKNIDVLKKDKDYLDKALIDNRGEMSVVSEEVNKITGALQEQLIIKNTIEINLKQARDKKDSIIREYKDYTKEGDNIAEQIRDINKNSSRLNDELTGTEDRNSLLEKEVVEKSKHLTLIKEELINQNSILEEINIEIANFKQKHEFIVEKIHNADKVIEGFSRELEDIKINSRENDSEILARTEAIEKLTKETEKNRNLIEVLNQEIQAAKTEKENQSREHKEFFEKREQLSERISALDKEVYRLSSQKEALEEKSENKEAYMWNEYEITYRKACEMKNQDFNDKSQIRENIANIRKEMKSLGDVNINAIEEFKEINERYQFMKSQHDDLMEAKENLLKIIDELEIGMRKQFKEKFEEIKIEFDKVFKVLFGGGKGTIELTEAEDILEAGINIISQPPGKKLQNMMQLSGGEKALTAISLLFAIQNLKPSPFCLLDEIEAALDGSNVVRFAEYLHKLTENTQFIVITHRRGTMNSADRLYGITMQEKGISALVSVDLLEKDLAK